MLRPVRATRAEQEASLPGDALIPRAVGAATNAITIGGPPREVWPWLVQMGGGRAGWYSYDVIDNARRPSATVIVPALQAIDVGTVLPAVPGASDGFRVLELRAPRYLVLGVVGPGPVPAVTWTFVLHELEGDGTRLIVRARVSADYPFFGLPKWLGWPFIRVTHAVMQRKQLLGITARVERTRRRATAVAEEAS